MAFQHTYANSKGYGVTPAGQNVNQQLGLPSDAVNLQGNTILSQQNSAINQANNQAANQSDLAQQQAGQNLVSQHQQGAFGVLNQLLNQGYISEAQKKAAQAQYGGVLGGLGDAQGIATGLAQTGGYSPDEWQGMLGNLAGIQGMYSDVANRGGLTDPEYNRILDSTRRDVMDMGRAAAESTFNASNVSSSPFAASALMSRAARDTGTALADRRADLDKYQADSRETGRQGLLGALGAQAGLYDSRVGNQQAGLNALMSALGLQGDIAGAMAGLETQTAPDTSSAPGALVERLMADLGNLVSTTSNASGTKKTTTTAYGESNTKDAKKPGERKSTGGGAGSMMSSHPAL